MKNLRPLILGIIIGALATYFFCPRQAAEEKFVADKTEVVKPKGVITVSEGKNLFKNWENNNPTVIDSTTEVEGSRKKITNVGWSLREIKDYLVYADSISDSLGYNMTGLRMYMGNYGNNAAPVNKNRNTVFIVPIGNKITSHASMAPFSFQGGGVNLPIPPLNRGGGGEEPYNP